MTVVEEAVESLTGSHVATFEARLCETFQTGDDPDGDRLPILGGDVTLDGTAKNRGTLGISTDGTGMWPRGKNLKLAPYGNEIFVRRGVHLGHTIAWSPLGYYRIDASEQDAPPDGPIAIRGADRMATIRDSRLPFPRSYPSGTTVGEIFDDLVLDVYPDAEIVFDDDSDQASVGRSVVVEEKRYETLKDLADSLGKILYWNGAGQLVIEDMPDPDVLAWHVKAGADGNMTDTRRRLTREKVYNGVVARGEGGDTEDPVQALVVDTGPNSPTRWGGRFGMVPRFYESPYLTTEQQAQDAAAGLLRKAIGLPYSVDFGAVVNPWLVPFDRVLIEQDNGDREVHQIERLRIPLVVDAAMTGGTRDQTFARVGG